MPQILPSPGGGMTLERIAQMNAVYGEDLLLLIGGAHHSFPFWLNLPPYPAKVSLLTGTKARAWRLLMHAEASPSPSIFLARAPGRKPGASLYTRTCPSVSPIVHDLKGADTGAVALALGTEFV